MKAGLSGDMRMLLLNRGLRDVVTSHAAIAADRQAFGSRQECIAMETALRDIFYAAYNARWELVAHQPAVKLRISSNNVLFKY